MKQIVSSFLWLAIKVKYLDPFIIICYLAIIGHSIRNIFIILVSSESNKNCSLLYDYARVPLKLLYYLACFYFNL